jgi:hypothetical protein
MSRVERITAVGILIESLESLYSAKDYRSDGVLDWEINGPWQFPLGSRRRRLAERLTPLTRYPVPLALPAVRAVAATRLLVGRPARTERGVWLGVLATTRWLTTLHHGIGGDGSDQITAVAVTATALEKAFSADPGLRHATAQFLAVQTCLSYFSSGSVKLFSPIWRDGTAITGIFRTRSYGTDAFHRLIKSDPRIPRLLAWTVIVGELTFPLVLVAPRRTARAILIAAEGFHVANGAVMGLNRFVWGFGGTHPAVAHVSRALRPEGKTGNV